MKFEIGDHVLFTDSQVKGLGITGVLYKKDSDFWCVKLDDPEILRKAERAGLTDWTPHSCNDTFLERVGLYGNEINLKKIKITTRPRTVFYQDRLKILLRKGAHR